MSNYPVKWVLIKRFAELTGHSENAVRQKIEKGVWCDGVEWKRGPDGRIRISVEAYDEWVNAA